MKKIIAISLLMGWLAATSAFGQGYFSFYTGKSQEVWDGFTSPGVNVSILAATVNTAFLWAPANTVPTVDNPLTSTPTNRSSLLYDGLSVSQSWAAILNGQFTPAVNNTTGALASALCSLNGTIAYLNGAAFPVTGTTPNTSYTVYMIGWDANYATPALAAAAYGGLGAAVGWSNPFQYTSVNSIGTPNSMVGQAAPFGTFGPVPEPGTFALATLGGLSLLAFRHRKK